MSDTSHLTITNLRTNEEIELFMSFGLLNEMIKLLGNDPSVIAQIDLDPALAEPLFTLLLAKRNTVGKITEAPSWDISQEDADRLFDWIKAAILDFLVRRLSSTKTLFESRKTQLQGLGLSLNGSQVEASKSA